MQRISVIGITGSGKTTIGRRLAQLLDLPFFELDSIYHQAHWTPMERRTFDATIKKIADGERWVIDGSYHDWTVEGPIWRRADTVVWVRVPKTVALRQMTWRSAKNVLLRRELWNGNRESLREHLSSDPNRSIFAHVRKRYDRYDQEFSEHVRDPRFRHVDFVVLRNRQEAEAWLATVSTSVTEGDTESRAAAPSSHP